MNRNELTVYPNPADNQFHIEGDALFNRKLSLSMYDMSGREVYQNLNLQTDGNSVTIHISQLPKGYYSLKLTSDQNKVIGYTKVMVR